MPEVTNAPKFTHGWQLAMSTRASWEYKTAGITVNLLAVRDLDDSLLENCWVHELAHVLVNEMRAEPRTAESTAHEERVCTLIADALIWARVAGVADGKKKKQ